MVSLTSVYHFFFIMVNQNEESQQARNRRLGRQFERDTYNRMKSDCTFAANFGGNVTSRNTPDVMCVQSPKNERSQKLRLAEAKRNGYIPPDQRDELVEIAEESPDYVQLEATWKPSPRGGVKKRIIHKPGQDPERTREILEEEFDHVKMEKVE